MPRSRTPVKKRPAALAHKRKLAVALSESKALSAPASKTGLNKLWCSTCGPPKEAREGCGGHCKKCYGKLFPDLNIARKQKHEENVQDMREDTGTD